jgi:hypothetical protein
MTDDHTHRGDDVHPVEAAMRDEGGWQPIETVLVPLTLGQYCLIDKCDLNFVATKAWQAKQRSDGNGFYAVNSAGERMHRILLDAQDGSIVDHRDGNGLDNRRCNIRIGTYSQNAVNRQAPIGKHLRGSQLVKGRWRAKMTVNGIQHSLGYYDTEQQAHEAYLEGAHKEHGDWMPLPAAPTEGE